MGSSVKKKAEQCPVGLCLFENHVRVIPARNIAPFVCAACNTKKKNLCFILYNQEKATKKFKPCDVPQKPETDMVA